MTTVRNIEQLVGQNIQYDGQSLKVSHYSLDGLMVTLHTDKGTKSFLKSNMNDELSKIQVGEKSMMKCTTEYEIFGVIESNRKIDMRHVKKLASAISDNNLLHLNPIIVDGYRRVVDGQHRLEAAKSLRIPIYYITDSGVGKTDIGALNSNKKNWSLEDYVNFHTKENKPGFKELSNFMALYPGMPVSSALTLLSSGGKRDTAAIRDGRVDVSNIDQAEEIAEFLLWLKEYYEQAYSDSVVQVIRKMFGAEGFDVEYLKKKIADQPRSLVKCINRKQYQEMFLEIYNYKLSINRLSL